MTGKRRLPTRNARQLSAQESSEKEMNISEDPFLPLLKENSVPAAIVYPSNKELCKKENTEKAKMLLSSNSSETDGSPASKSTAHPDVDDLFESNDLSANHVASKVALRPKAIVETKSLVSQVPEDGERLFVPLALDGTNNGDQFQPGKTSKKLSPASFMEDEEDLFTTSKTAVKRKDPKPTALLDQDPPMQDIFEDDIFALEANKLPIKIKGMEANLFDVDIFADLAVKPIKRSANKRMEAKSIFHEDTDDIFSSNSQPNTLTKQAQTFQTASGTTSECRASSTFEDPLNAFEGQ